MRDRSRAYHQAIGLPVGEIEVWAAETSVTEASPAAGVPVPSAKTQLALTASGEQTESWDVRIQDPGVPTLDTTASGVLCGATMLMKPASDSDWYGHNLPYGLHRWETVVRSTVTPEYTRDPDVISTASGVLLIVADHRDSGVAGEYQLAVWRRDVVTGAWSKVVIASQPSAPSGKRCPCIVQLPSGRLHVYEWVADAVLRLWYSDDDGDTWSFGGARINDYTPTAGTVERCRVAYSRGQLLMVLDTDDSGLSVSQYASSDLGLTFQRVVEEAAGTSSSAGLSDVCASPFGGFVVIVAGFESATGLRSYAVSDAYAPFDESGAVNVGNTMAAGVGGVDETSDDAAIVADETGVLYCYGRIDATQYGTYSYDGGRTWQEMLGPGAFVGQFPTSGDYIDTYSAAMHRGRVVLAHQWTAGTASWASDLGVAYLGGWATATYPSNRIGNADPGMAGWRYTWLPIELPQNAGWGVTGSGTEALSATAGEMTITTSANTRIYTLTTAPAANAGAFRFACKPTSTVIGDQRLTYSNGTLQITIRLGAAGFEVWDDVASALVGSIAGSFSTTGVEIWVELDSANTAIETKYRVPSTSELTEWIAGPSVASLTGGSPARIFTFGHLTSHSATSTWYEIVWDDSTNRNQRTLLRSLPADLRGRPMAGLPYIGGGLYLRSRGGPAWRGEEWTIPPRPLYGVRNILASSPRISWRSTSVTSSTIALRLDNTITANSYGDSRVLALVLRGSNVSNLNVSYYNTTTSAWVSLGSATLSIGGLNYARSGKTLVPASGGDSLYMRHHEFAGGTVSDGTNAARIVRNTEGRWDATFPLRPIITVAAADSSSMAASGTLDIIPEQVVLLINLQDVQTAGIRLETSPGTLAPAENYYEIGAVSAFWLHALGTEYAWGRQLSTQPDVERIESRDGQVRTIVRSPTRRSVEIQWDPIDTTDVETESPGYVSLGGTIDPTESERGTAWALEGYARELDGEARLACYLPHVPRLAGRLTVLHRRRDAIVGRITSAATATSVLGAEHVDEVLQPGSLVLDEEV